MGLKMAAAGMVATGLFLISSVQADLFDDAKKSIPIQVGRADSTGVSIRGGASLQSGQQPGTATLLRGQANIGGGCGAFNFATSFEEVFKEMPDLLENLAAQIGANIPMLVLCWSAPSACDIVKHVQGLSNIILQARFAQCQQAQSLAQYGGQRLRGGAISQCLEDAVNSGTSLSEALKTCNGSVSSLRTPGGTNGPEVNLVKDTLAAAGVSTETQTLAKSLLGEITLRANAGQLGSDHSRPQAAMLARYEDHRQTSDAALRAAVQELRDTGTVSDATLRAVSVPGQPLPRAALDALVALQKDQVRSESMLAKLSTGMAVTQLTWECTNLQEQLTAATDANTQLTDEEKRLLERRYDGLRRDLASVLAKKEVLEKHLQPAIDALLSEYTAVQNVATKAGLKAPSVTVIQMPYHQQAPAGYGQ